jgi:uroporphyrinogen III methyltransferase/synthase
MAGGKMVSDKKGKVYLVGAGPGDPGLLTLRAKECIERADVIIYDYLANEAFLGYADSKAELIYVGKMGGSHSKSQDEINRLICNKAEKGLNVVRLKGGDPFIFGRGGEEAQELVKAGITFEIVPGVTSAVAVPAYAGIPLTHRDYASTVAFITGHEDPAKDESDIDWKRLATGVGTLVFLMGVGNLGKITEELINNGRSPDTPAAVICRGTVAGQKTIEAKLRDIADIAKGEDIKPPGIIVVGDVVGLRSELNWFEQRPLFGKRIVVTRAREQASRFLSALAELGAECIEFPAIEIMPPGNFDGMDKAISSIEDYDWLLFTSVNGVKYFFDRLRGLGRDIRSLKDIRLGAIGPKTSEALLEKGIRPDLLPDEYMAEAMVDEFKKLGAKGLRILIPRAMEARDLLPDELRKMGGHVDVVEAYRTVMPETGTGKVRAMLEAGEIQMVTFTSSSTVTNFIAMFKEDGDKIIQWMEGVDVACIGPVTAKTAEENGLKVSIAAKEYTIEALTDAIVDYYSKEKS